MKTLVDIFFLTLFSHFFFCCYLYSYSAATINPRILPDNSFFVLTHTNTRSRRGAIFSRLFLLVSCFASLFSLETLRARFTVSHDDGCTMHALFSSKPQHTHTHAHEEVALFANGSFSQLVLLHFCLFWFSLGALSLSGSSGIGSSSCRYSCVLLCLLLLLLLLLLLFTILLLHIKQSRVLFLCLTVDAVLFPKGARVGDDCSSVAPCCCLAG